MYIGEIMIRAPREIRRLWIKLILIFLVFIAISGFVAFENVFLFPEVDPNSEVSPTIINGLITGFAVIFGFVTFEMREIKAHVSEKFALGVPLVTIFVFAIAKYSGEMYRLSYPTFWSMMIFDFGIFFSVFYSFELLYAKVEYERLFKKGLVTEWLEADGKS